MRILAAWLMVLLPAAAAGPDPETVIAAALRAPGELAAEALLRLASLDNLPAARRLELLQQAFVRASAAQQPYRRRGALVRGEGAVNLLNKVHAQDVDTLGLQLRAVESMLPLDAPKARELFGRIPELRLPRLSCEDFLVYDPSRFYRVLESLAVAEPGRAERARLLQPYPAAMRSAVQVAGMARVLAAADVEDAAFQKLLADFISALATIKNDDRSFTWSTGIGRQIEALTAEAGRRKISELPLLESYRVYLVFNLSAARCADGDLMQGGNLQSFALRTPEDSDPQSAEFASYFNRKLRRPPLQLIQEAESQPSRVEGAAGGLRACQDPECQGFVTRFRTLLTMSKATPEWSRGLEETLSGLGEWTRSTHAGPGQFFLEKASAYSELLSLAPPGAARDLVVASLTAFLEQSPAQESHRAEWLLAVSALTGRVTLDPLGFGSYGAALSQSKNPLIALYAALEALAPRAPHRILPLL